MRVVFGALSLLVVVAIVAVLAKKQLGSVSGSAPVPASLAPGVASAPTGTPQQQVRQVQQATEAAIQARAMPDEPK